MALVMLPCDLPWWPTLQNYLKKLLTIKHTVELIEGMNKIYELCNISLDPEDDEITDNDLFTGLLNFLDNDLTCEERSVFLTKTLHNIINRALHLQKWKPMRGLHFSLQQQADCIELDYKFISSLIAHCFFSTFPRRTAKTHPTLQDFNFTHFFKYLHTTSQKTKFKSILHYFDWLEQNSNSIGSIKVYRQVMTSKEWFTIEDWLECTLPLCTLQMKHDAKLECNSSEMLHICFASSRIGGSVLSNGISQECVTFVTLPELLAVLLNVEALEDNEVLTVENLRRVTTITDPKKKACLEKLSNSEKITVCCMDAEDYRNFPINQYEEDNILRELNKCFLGFQQKQNILSKLPHKDILKYSRLSTIDESVNSSPPETNTNIIISQASMNSIESYTKPSQTFFKNRENNLSQNMSYLKVTDNVVNNRKGRFIMLGSSGEYLPVSRKSFNIENDGNSNSSCSTSEDEFHSAQESFEEVSSDSEFNKRYSIDLETPEKRNTFAQRLRNALRREANTANSSTDESSYAVGISISGSGLNDGNIKLRRGGSRGFMLREESIDETYLRPMNQRKKLSRNNSDNNSSNYSFSIDYNSEMEDSDYFKEASSNNEDCELNDRDLAVVQFASSLLKRTLSESFAGFPLSGDGCDIAYPISNDKPETDTYAKRRNRFVLNSRSLSLELARKKHKLAAHLVSQLEHKTKDNRKTVSSGNWGCGSSHAGDPQLKLILQWLAASVAGVSVLMYHTAGHQELSTLDTVCRILVDRKWTVKDLLQETLSHSIQYLHGKSKHNTLFEDLIGVERID